MANIEKLRILIADEEPEFLGRLSDLLITEFGVAVPAEASGFESIRSALRSDEFDVVVLGPSFATEEGIASAGAVIGAYPRLGVGLVVPRATTFLLRSAIRAGFTDVVETPVSSSKAEQLLRRVLAEFHHPDSSPVDESLLPSYTVAVLGPKGGVGRTTVATNVAAAMAKQVSPERVCVFDADLQFGDVCLALSVDPKSSILDLAHDEQNMDMVLLEATLLDAPIGVKVLAAPPEPAFAEEVTTRLLNRVVGLLRDRFNVLVIDMAATLDDRTLALLESADEVLVVVSDDLASVKNTKLLMDTLRLLDFPTSMFSVVMNHPRERGGLSRSEVSQLLELDVISEIPTDPTIGDSVDEGSPVVLFAPKSKPARSFEDLRVWLWERVPVEVRSLATKGRRRRARPR